MVRSCIINNSTFINSRGCWFQCNVFSYGYVAIVTILVIFLLIACNDSIPHLEVITITQPLGFGNNEEVEL